MTIVSEFEAGATRLSNVDRDQWHSLPVWWVRADIKPDMRKFRSNSCCQVLKFSLILKKRRERCPGQLHRQSGGYSSCCCPAEESCAWVIMMVTGGITCVSSFSRWKYVKDTCHPLFSLQFLLFAPSELLVVDQSDLKIMIRNFNSDHI